VFTLRLGPKHIFVSSGHPVADLSRFEVLLGPQGTLYGHNAEGGVFNVVCREEPA
jgi:outer membrane receptor for ferrienterochelin and colicin